MNRLLLPIAIAVALTACATTETADDSMGTPVDERSERLRDRGAEIRAGDVAVDATLVRSLADLLIRLPGVFVDERGPATRVRLRGRTPLYVVDNLPVGFSYFDADNLVVPTDIQRVDVLTGIEATARYGYQGGNGATVLTTRRG